MMTAKPASAPQAKLFDAELADLPPELRWREWMGRIEAAIFASAEPVPREALSGLVGQSCVLDDLIADIQDELKARPYELVVVAGGWQHRTRPRFAETIRAAAKPREPGPPDLSKTETMVLTVVGYFQPVTRAKISEMLGKEISRDTIARLKRLGLIGAGPRVAQAGAPLTYVTTPAFLSVFGLATLRDLPEIEGIEEMGRSFDGGHLSDRHLSDDGERSSSGLFDDPAPDVDRLDELPEL
jgi:segregation and condensation protein B